MTSKDRFLAAIQNKVPDRVPVTPDISNMIPVKRTGLPFWDVYFHEKIPRWRAYLDAADHFGIDAWIASCWGYGCQFEAPANIESESRIEFRPEMDATIKKTVTHTPDGDLTTESLCFRADPPSPTQKPIKDLAADFKKFKWLLQPPVALNRTNWNEVRDECHKHGHAFGVGCCYPGFHNWFSAMQDGLESLSFALIDAPEILDEWCELQTEHDVKGVELILAEKPDYVALGGSGTITLSSPDIVRRYTIPALKKMSRLCRDAGIPTVLHSCGKSRILVDMLVEETDVNCINPLEIPPMGDIDLAEVKRSRGSRIALMGNLHTTDVMLRGTPDLVRQRSRDAIRDAGQGGGFILSTGDQCGRDTPDENLFAMVETAKKFGVYDQASGKLLP